MSPEGEARAPGLWPLPPELEAEAGRNAGPLRAYFFLRSFAGTEDEFDLEQLAEATGWSGDTPRTYVSKQWKQLLDKVGQERYRVKSDFRRLNLQRFLKNFTQVKLLFAEYERSVFTSVVSYEFLLPLTREAQLRESLDDLFFSDAVEQRAREIGAIRLAEVTPRLPFETDDTFVNRVCAMVGDKFGGYSIVHVAGRFRASDGLRSRSEAGDMLATGQRYVIDETTASVRFIAPVSVSRRDFAESMTSIEAAISPPNPGLLNIADVEDEVRLVRRLFFSFFVEAVVKTVQGEDEIWLLEDSPAGRRLFVWRSKVAQWEHWGG